MSEPSSDAFVQYRMQRSDRHDTFNRPEKLNAFNDAMVMRARQRAARVRHSTRPPTSLVLRGNGRAFSSGADVHQRQLRSDEDLIEAWRLAGWGAHAADLFTRAINWKPVIAAPHGFAVGLGLGMVLESEMVVAEAGTRFQVTETSRGLASSRYGRCSTFAVPATSRPRRR
jgi:enoyl-CoA hydratase/carnithine racemase